jgi:mono/diheme cytochrome c family protein
MIRIALQGLTGPVEVDGEEWNLEMPPLETALPDEQVAAALTYVRRSWGNEADPVEPAAVAAVRAETRERRRPWTADELKALR